MRWFHLLVIGLFALITLIFAIQNFQVVTVSFLSLGVRAPMALVTVVVYLLGMATGGSLISLLRWSWAGTRHRTAA